MNAPARPAADYPYLLRGLDLPDHLTARAEAAKAALRPDVDAREVAGGAPEFEKQVLRDNGLLIGPWADGGPETWGELYGVLAEVGTVDPSAAWLAGYHHQHVLLLIESGNEALAQWAVRETVANGWLWSGANHPSGQSESTVVQVEGGWLLNGRKDFATGSLVGDQFIIQERFPTEAEPKRRVALVVDGHSPGLVPLNNWEGIGIVRSSSNSIELRDVFVPESKFIKFSSLESGPPLVSETAASPAFQLMFVNVYLGIVIGVLRRAYDFLHGDNAGQPDRRLSLSQVQEIFGELVGQAGLLRSGLLYANESLDRYLKAPGDARAVDRLNLDVAALKTPAHQIVVDATTKIFETVGSRGAVNSTGFDRYWRDARHHTLHGEQRAAYRNLGVHALAVSQP
ncbi:MAG: hypothetical protein LBC97_14170 [Bifidobacteriaceae bacterium]|nr:hypothetical protein [Bifidobacteriaceae bacterium]